MPGKKTKQKAMVQKGRTEGRDQRVAPPNRNAGHRRGNMFCGGRKRTIIREKKSRGGKRIGRSDL